MSSYTAKYVIENSANMTIWDDRVWVNHIEKTFFVPIWRNGNTEFMLAAEQFGYTLEKDCDLDEFTGYAFVRHPKKRIAGQIWRAMQNQHLSFEHCVNLIMNNDISDPHFRTQQSFIDSYNMTYLIDLDDLHTVGHQHIDTVIEHMLQPRKKESAIDSFARNDIEVQLKDTTVIEKYRDDALLCMPTVGVVGVGKIGSVLCDTLTQSGIQVQRYDVNETYDTIESVAQCDIIWICVDTPTTVDNQPSDYDYTNLRSALANFDNKTVIVGCTVSPGTCEKLDTTCNIIYMPFLISQGDVMTGLTSPDCWFIGGEYNWNVDKIVSHISQSVQHWGTWQEAELAKALYNSWIIQKINFANWAGDLAKSVGNADASRVMGWLGDSNQLITSSAYMKPGWGDGGPCHPRDNLMMSWVSRHLNYDPAWNQHTTRLAQAELMAKQAVATRLPVIILGKSYKPDVDSTEGSYSLVVADYIKKQGGEVYYEDHLTPGDYCYILAHNKWYGHESSPNSKVINPW
jgi:UDPglucose 6-dehydrogenase